MPELVSEPEAADNIRPMTAQELAGLTGWKLPQVYAMTRSGALPAIRVGRRVFYPRPAILRMLAAGREEPVSDRTSDSAPDEVPF